MSNLPMDFSEVIENFSTPGELKAYEITGARQPDGTWNGPASTPWDLAAVVLTAKLQELEILAPGEASAGGIVLQTEETLYFQNAENAGVQDKQSFVTYQGLTYRVLGTGLMNPLAGFNLYTAIRYMEAGVVAQTE